MVPVKSSSTISKKEWVDEWDTMVAGSDYLPTHVRLTLTVLDEHGHELTYSTDARIQMTETCATWCRYDADA